MLSEEREKLISFLNEYFESILKTQNIGQIKWNVSRQTPIDKTISDRYNDMSVKNFLTLYKIDRLEISNIINSIIAQSLRDLFYLKLDLEKRINEIALSNREGIKVELQQLMEEYIRIENIFNKYHLLDDVVDLTNTIDNAIVKENYGFLNQNVKKHSQIYHSASKIEESNLDRTIKYLNALLENDYSDNNSRKK